MNTKRLIWNTILVTSLLGGGLGSHAQDLKGKKVYYINSYHTGYSWSDSIQQSIEKTLAPQGVEMKVALLDTYRDKTPEHLTKVSAECKAVIDQWQPDVVVASDDPSLKGVFAPFYKDSKVPFVFCGVNWTAAAYGVPCKNITGMLEVCPVKDLVTEMNKLKPGKTIGYLSADALTPQKDAENSAKILGVKLETVFAKDFAAWKQGLVDLQTKIIE